VLEGGKTYTEKDQVYSFVLADLLNEFWIYRKSQIVLSSTQKEEMTTQSQMYQYCLDQLLDTVGKTLGGKVFTGLFTKDGRRLQLISDVDSNCRYLVACQGPFKPVKVDD
jgi:hypothetical protein